MRGISEKPNRCLFVLDSLQTTFSSQLANFSAVNDACLFSVSLFATGHGVSQNFSQSFGVIEAALQDNLII